jgi:hypothetical protein
MRYRYPAGTMSLPLPIFFSLTPEPGKGRMELECESVTGGRYRLFALESDHRWEVLPPGAPPDSEVGGWTREEVVSAAILAGFSKRQIERAMRAAGA